MSRENSLISFDNNVYKRLTHHSQMWHLAGETQLRFARNPQPLRFWETRGNSRNQISLATEVAFHVGRR